MKRTTIVLSDELAVLLERERRRRGVPASVIVREALAGYFGERPEALAIVGLGQSGHTHTASDMEELIAREWTYERLMGVPENRAPTAPGRATFDQLSENPAPDGESAASQ